VEGDLIRTVFYVMNPDKIPADGFC
jgi:hypothetical protein